MRTKLLTCIASAPGRLNAQRLLTAGVLALLSACATQPTGLPDEDDPPWLTTKTPYRPRQALQALEPVPAGYAPLHTQLVARHGARGMTSPKSDLALLQMWRAADAEGALTPLGRQLGPDLERLIAANARLGQGVPGIRRPGYGNLSRRGIEEQEGLARRTLARMPALFEPAAGGAAPRIEVLTSGVDRAQDSAHFHTQALLHAHPALAPALRRPVLRGYPADAPRAQEPGVNRFLLYFHKLNARTDRVTDPADPALATYQRSLAYQAAADDPRLADLMAQVRGDPEVRRTALHVLQRLFQPAFVDALSRGERSFSNAGSFEVSSDRPGAAGPVQVAGDGSSVIAGTVDALLALSDVYEIAPGLRHELGGRHFGAYLPQEAARLLAWVNDAEDFYFKGPGLAERGDVNHAMAGQLLDDMFARVDAAASAVRDGTAAGGRELAVFRFTHAEIIVPLATALAVGGAREPLPAWTLYRYGNHAWRGSEVAPYSANIQWDAWRNAEGQVLVRMLYNEGQTAFKPACDGARVAPGSHFYRLDGLRACHGRGPAHGVDRPWGL